MLKLDALQKYENALLENFSPSVLRELKRSNWNGLLREIDRLYATMYHEWDALQKDVVDLEDAVRSLTWTVNPYSREGEEPGDLAREIAQLVTDALWAKAPHEPGAIGHTFPQLLGALVHHRLRGFNVHQIVWRKAGDMVYPARYIQLPPQFMVWETKAGHPDRLLLVEDGMSADGVPFPPHKYIVALNHNGPDHPLYNATFYSLVNWFVAFKFGLGWFMEYAQKYGMPKQVIRYANEKDRQQIVDDLSDESVLNTVLIKEGQGSGFEMQYPTGGAASLPQAVLVQKAEEACHKAILGQTLTSDTSASGGSLAQAKVHAGVQADVVMKLAEAVADILNQQLIPAIIQANYGRVQGLPIPELRCKLPQAVASIERAQFLKTALEIPGMRVVKSEAYEYLNLSQPGNDDEVFEAKDPAQEGMGGFGGGFPPGGGGGEDGKGGFPGGGADELPDSDAKDEVVMSARGVKKNDPAVDWLAPLKEKLREARSSGASLSEIKEQIRAWKPNTRALADAMAQNIAAGYARGSRASQEPRNGNVQQDEEVRAENPYGCNQHGHGWVDACPYGGGGSNGLAGKSALQFAGGAENVNPEPDEDEEDKKKKESEAKAKAEEEARKKAEAEKKAKEEAERKAREEEEERKKKEFDDETEALKKEVKQDALDKVQPFKDEIQAIIDQNKGKKLTAQQKTALAYLAKLKEGLDNKVLEGLTWQDWQIEHRTEITDFDKEKLKQSAPFYINRVLKKAREEADKRIVKLQGFSERIPSKDIEKELEKLPGKIDATKVCAKAASTGKGSIQTLWNNTYNADQQRAIYRYSDGYYEEMNDAFRGGKTTQDTRLITEVFKNAKLGVDLTVSRGENTNGFYEYDPNIGKIAKDVEKARLDWREGNRQIYEYMKKKLNKGERLIRTSSAPTSTSVRNSSAFDAGVMRLTHIPKGAQALCIAPVSYYETGSFAPGEKIDINTYKERAGSGEKEVLLKPGSRFRLINVQLDKFGNLLIEEELIVE